MCGASCIQPAPSVQRQIKENVLSMITNGLSLRHHRQALVEDRITVTVWAASYFVTIQLLDRVGYWTENKVKSLLHGEQWVGVIETERGWIGTCFSICLEKRMGLSQLPLTYRQRVTKFGYFSPNILSHMSHTKLNTKTNASSEHCDVTVVERDGIAIMRQFASTKQLMNTKSAAGVCMLCLSLLSAFQCNIRFLRFSRASSCRDCRMCWKRRWRSISQM
jgi:hypothetical protein